MLVINFIHFIILTFCFAVDLTPGQTSVAVVTSGRVKFEGNKEFSFVQNFTIATTQGGPWKIVSDCFRYQE